MITPEIILLRLAVATLLGAVVGMERERLERAAGLRTHALVCLGAALFMQVSSFGFSDILGSPSVVLDPSRIAAQVVSGIGFLGAGTIVFQHGSVRGLTTAASVWAVAAIGLSVGGGLYLAAVSATVFCLLILVAFKPLEKRMYKNQRPIIQLIVDRQEFWLADLYPILEAAGARPGRIIVTSDAVSTEDRLEVSLILTSNLQVPQLLDRVRRVQGVRQILINARFENTAVDDGKPKFDREIDEELDVNDEE